MEKKTVIREITKLLKVNPQKRFADISNLQGVLSVYDSDFNQADVFFKESLKINPFYQQAGFNCFYLNFIRNQKIEISTLKFEKLIKNQKKSPPLESKIFLICLLLLKNDLNKVSNIFQSIPKKFLKANSKCLFLHGMMTCMQKNPEKGILNILKAISQSTFIKNNVPESFYLLSAKTEFAKMIPLLLESIKNILEKMFYTPMFCKIAEFFLSSMNFDKTRLYLTFIEKYYDFESYDYLSLKADLALTTGHKKSAEFLLLAADKLDPVRARPVIKLSILYGEKSEIKKAIQVLKKSLKWNPYYPDLYYHIGEIYAASGAYLKAEKYLKNALKLNPDYIMVLFELGNIYQNTERYNDSLITYIKISAIPEYAASVRKKIQTLYEKSSFINEIALKDLIVKQNTL